MSNQPGQKLGLAKTGNSWAGKLADPGCLVAPLIIAAAIFSLVSVAASGIFLGLGITAWILDCLISRSFILSLPPFKLYLLLFIEGIL